MNTHTTTPNILFWESLHSSYRRENIFPLIFKPQKNSIFCGCAYTYECAAFCRILPTIGRTVIGLWSFTSQQFPDLTVYVTCYVRVFKYKERSNILESYRYIGDMTTADEPFSFNCSLCPWQRSQDFSKQHLFPKTKGITIMHWFHCLVCRLSQVNEHRRAFIATNE